MSALDELINSDDELHFCVFMPAITCKTGESSRCKECENNPATYISDPELLKKFQETPWATFCMSCGEFGNPNNHPGHLIAVGYEEYREKVPAMIMDRLKRRNQDGPTENPFP